MAATEYVLQPRPPVRAFLLAALATSVSAIMIVVSRMSGWPLVVPILFGVLFVAGVALASAGFTSMRRRQVYVWLDDDGYRIVGNGQERKGSWKQIRRLTETTDGRHITIYADDAETHLLCPSGTSAPQFRSMLTDMAHRLDRAHGYGS
ncbi:MAG: YcxB family protein [Propionibacteriaceae bacterium]|nr:YcxB family protein [Propionibacteriaceae bacterium]